MSINTSFVLERKEITWQDQSVCVVRGLTPHDIIKVIAENPVDADTVLSSLAEKAGAVAETGAVTADAVADALQSDMASFGQIVMKVPDLIAKVVAVACDSPESWQHVRDNFVIPLQFEIVQEIARMTFVDPPAFRRFLGNVMALVGQSKTGQRLPGKNASAG
jgi:hypothetical protein